MDLGKFNMIEGESLNEILFQRYDTKYLCLKDQIEEILNKLHYSYDLVSFNGNLVSINQTIY